MRPHFYIGTARVTSGLVLHTLAAWCLSVCLFVTGANATEMAQTTDLPFAEVVHARPGWMDNIKTRTGLSVDESSVDESTRMTEDSDKWRKYVHGVANPRIEDG